MMWAYYSVLGLSFLLLAITLRILHQPFHRVAEGSIAVVDALIARLPEDEKVPLVQQRMNRLSMALLKSFGVVLTGFVIGVIPLILYSNVSDLRLEELDFSSGRALLATSIGLTIGFIIPTKIKQRSTYSELSKLLHRMILNHYAIAYKLFKWDQRWAKKSENEIGQKFLIISGLARSGTTSLMNALARLDQFDSLSYANMPFITSPGLWSRIYRPKSRAAQERSHKDGIRIGLTSNEALEEYFFKMLSRDAYIDKDGLKFNRLDKVQYADYLMYQKLIKKSNGNFYIAKNNNFILHYKSIREFNPEFVMVIMFRDPLKHASSLLDMHRLYSKLQGEDPFVLEYMNWLGHHEFGLNQKPFLLGVEIELNRTDRESIDYWLERWITYYSYVLSLKDLRLYFLAYERYCMEPNEVIKSILKEFSIEKEAVGLSPFKNDRKESEGATKELVSRANAIYEELFKRSI